MKRSVITMAAILAMAATPALAHTVLGTGPGFPAGFAHPFGGLDHMLAMFAVGILAAQTGGRNALVIPAVFLTMMAAGAVSVTAGFGLPLAEQGIIGSLIILGAVIAFGNRIPATAAVALAGLAAVFHGHAHGAELPAGLAGLEYGAGFLAATAVLIAAGLATARADNRAGTRGGAMLPRLAGGAITFAGLALAAS